MRILFLSNFYPPLHLGGHEELCADVVTGLRQRGHAVAVLTSRHGVRTTTSAEHGVHRRLHLEVDLRPYRAALNFFVGRRGRGSENRACFTQAVADFQPDVVMVWAMWNLSRALPALAESWERPPVVYYVADYAPTLPDAFTLYWREPARRWSTQVPKSLLGRLAHWMAARDDTVPPLKFAHAICVSYAVRQRLADSGLPFADAAVIYNGIDVRRFQRSDAAKEAGAHPRELSVLYAGRLAREKGVHTAITALGHVIRRGTPATLTVLGGGSAEYQAALRQLAHQLGVADRVRFRAAVPRDQMPGALADFDVLVVPSVWPEPLSRMIQEGMAAGLIVIAARVGGIPEIVEDGTNGLLFTPGDANELAARIADVMRDPGLRARLNDAARQTVTARFDIARMLDEIETYLQHIVDGRV